MNWDDLRVFLAVARQPKLEAVAAQLNMDATTISRRIRKLESKLGDTLFERTRRGHVLTPAGEHLTKRVEEMESVSLDISTGSEAKLAVGRVRLGVPEGLGATVVAPALKSFRAIYPKIDVDLIALSGFVSVPKREADMSLLLARPTSGRLKVKKISDYTLGLYATEDYLASAPPISSKDGLSAHTLIGYVDDLIYSSQLRYLDELVPGLTPDLCSPSILAQREMIAAGAGVGILPNFMAEKTDRLIRLIPGRINVVRTFWLAVHEDVARLKRNRHMIDFLTETLADLP
ncbi:MAG: LysR family transcriptional regulator [Henriciella sp.]|nr:LysR family transcriptional regulator [Henriciella sp.]